MNEHALEELGWNARFAQSFADLAAPDSRPGRVAAQSETTFSLFASPVPDVSDGPKGSEISEIPEIPEISEIPETSEILEISEIPDIPEIPEISEISAVLTGRMTGIAAANPAYRPVVGDWVVFTPGSGSGPAIIRDVLPRQTVFQRKTAQVQTESQVVAANLTTVFLMTSADAGFNLRRMERYLVQAFESGAVPVVVLNKADLADDPDRLLADLRATAPGCAVHGVSAMTGEGLEALAPYLGAGQTVALLGSSGVGKSTLVNAIAGTELRRTGEVRQDDSRGRHTTTDRRLLRLPSGALLLDTPGMRELALWADSDTVDAVFPDIAALAGDCRFSNCAHQAEPGCAVKNAVETGTLAPKRLTSYLKLASEAERLERRRAAKTREAPKGRKRRLPGEPVDKRLLRTWD